MEYTDNGISHRIDPVIPTLALSKSGHMGQSLITFSQPVLQAPLKYSNLIYCTIKLVFFQINKRSHPDAGEKVQISC